MSDAVNKPAHYNQGSIECVDAMQIVLTPEEYRGFLKGNAIKYLWREKNKNGIEDLRKAKLYLDRLIEHCDESLLDANKGLVKAWTCENGKAKQVYPEPKWTPKVGDWVRIKKPADSQTSATSWWPSMDKYDGQIIQVKQIEEDGVVLEEWGFMFDWLELAEPPKEQPQLPDGWRWLEVGEVIRNGDSYWYGARWYDFDCSIGEQLVKDMWPSIRRNRFDVGEKVVHVDDKEPIVYIVNGTRGDGAVIVSCRNIEYAISPNKLAPYIEETT